MIIKYINKVLEYTVIPILVLLVCCDVILNEDDTSSKQARMCAYLKDTANVPLSGIEVSTKPTTAIHNTDSDGAVYFDDIKPGNYEIFAMYNDSTTFQWNVVLKPGFNLIYLITDYNITLNLSIKHANELALDDVTISTGPPTSVYSIDANGHTTIKLPASSYTFVITRGSVKAYIPDVLVTLKNGPIQDKELIINPQKPTLNLKNMHNYYIYNNYDITFYGEGVDFEDGVLPSEALSWYSDIDGYLGSGETLYVNRMTVGKHRIMLQGIDSSGFEGQFTTNIQVQFRMKDSFFPLPVEGWWKYKNNPEQFNIIKTNGETATYRLMDITTRIIDPLTRNYSMLYSVDDLDWYQYSVTDYYELEHDTLFFTQSHEKLDVWEHTSTNNDPTYSISVNTVFAENISLLPDHFFLKEGELISIDTTADVEWKFTDNINNTQLYTGINTIDMMIINNGYESLSTDAGTFEAVKLRILEGDTERFWWLAKGYGIIQYSFITSDISVTASLFDTNLDVLQEIDQSVNKQSQTFINKSEKTTSPTPSITSNILNTDEMHLLIQRFRNMVPRL